MAVGAMKTEAKGAHGAAGRQSSQYGRCGGEKHDGTATQKQKRGPKAAFRSISED
jgi:hypothetical protein